MLLFLVLDYRHGFEALSVSRFKANVSSFYCNTKLALRNNNLSNYTKNLSLHRIHPMLQFFRVFWNKLKNKNLQTNHFHNKKTQLFKTLRFRETSWSYSSGNFVGILPLLFTFKYFGHFWGDGQQKVSLLPPTRSGRNICLVTLKKHFKY